MYGDIATAAALSVVAGKADVSIVTEPGDQILTASRPGRSRRGGPERRPRRSPDDDQRQERQDRPGGAARPAGPRRSGQAQEHAGLRSRRPPFAGHSARDR